MYPYLHTLSLHDALPIPTTQRGEASWMTVLKLDSTMIHAPPVTASASRVSGRKGETPTITVATAKAMLATRTTPSVDRRWWRTPLPRSDERRVGTECVRRCRSGGSRYH